MFQPILQGHEYQNIMNIRANEYQGNINTRLANTYVLGIIDGTYVGMCEDTGTI